jgi:hypothetical protein
VPLLSGTPALMYNTMQRSSSTILLESEFILSPDLKPDTAFQFTEFLRSLSYQRYVAQGSTMVVIFDLPPPCPPDNLGGVPLPSIPEGRVYNGMLTNCSALQGVSLEEKISHNGHGTAIERQDRISKTRTLTTQCILRQNLSSVVSQLQRMASDQAELLKKFKEKQDRRAQRAARKAEKAVDAMMSMMRDFLKSHSTGSQKKKSSTIRSTKSTNRNAFPAVTLFENQSGKVLCKKDSDAISDKFSTAECSQNNMDNNNKISKRNITTEGCSMNPPAKSICNNGLFTINNSSGSTDYNALQSNKTDPDKRPNEIPKENLNEIPKENLSLTSQLNKEHSASTISTSLSKNLICK